MGAAGGELVVADPVEELPGGDEGDGVLAPVVVGHVGEGLLLSLTMRVQEPSSLAVRVLPSRLTFDNFGALFGDEHEHGPGGGGHGEGDGDASRELLHHGVAGF